MRQEHDLDLFTPSDLEPRSLGDAEVRARRMVVLERDMDLLKEYTERLRQQRPDWYVPHFDPAGGDSSTALTLFLFEKPGPMTHPDNGGSGLLSVCNDDPTAEATHAFLGQNGLWIDQCLFANVIPWWHGTRKISREQRALAGEAIPALIERLHALQAIVLVGRTAQRAWDRIGLKAPSGVRVFRSLHTSPLVRARYPKQWKDIPNHWPNKEWLSRADFERKWGTQPQAGSDFDVEPQAGTQHSNPDSTRPQA
jgi:hypothetical protein